MQVLIIFLVLCSAEAQLSYEKYFYVWGNELSVDYSFVIQHIDMDRIFVPDAYEKRSARKVKTLYIHHTTFTTIPQSYVKFFKNLTSLRVEETDLKHVTAMQNLSMIKNLYLGKNQIDVIDHDAFDNLHNVEQLYLNRNKISHLDDLTFFRLHKLKMIMLDDNRLTSLSAELFSKNLNLEKVYVAGNRIALIAPSFFDHPSVISYNLKNNTCINMKTGWFNLFDLKLHAENCCQLHKYHKCASPNEDDLFSSDMSNNHI